MKRFSWRSWAVSLPFGALITGSAIVGRPFGLAALPSATIGLTAFALAVVCAMMLVRARRKTVIGGFIGLFAGAVLGLTFVRIFSAAIPATTPLSGLFGFMIPALLSYVGLMVGLAKSADLSLGFGPIEEESSSGKVLDTSVLIDGRITDIISAGFLQGPLVVPAFVLHELQMVADSADSIRRTRGRRGLDVVKQLQSIPDLEIEISSQDFPSTREVDLKLIEFAKLRRAKIVTNDFNLNKLAQVQGVGVLNINQLANCLRPVVLPGEAMRVFVLKEGKEPNQGIAYLDDGTMVVVDNARRMISKNIDITVTSVLQTTAGKMIFGRYEANGHAERRSVSVSGAIS